MKIKSQKIWKNFKSFRFNSLLVRNFVLIFCVVMIPMLSMTYAVQKRYNQVVEEEIMTASFNGSLRMKETVDRAMNEVTRLATYLSITEDYALYFDSTKEYMDERTFYHKLRSRTNEYMGIYDYVDSIYFKSNAFQSLFGEIDTTLEEIGIEYSTLEDEAWYNEDAYKTQRINRYFAWQENRQGRPRNNYISTVHYARTPAREYKGSVTVNVRSSYLSKMISTDQAKEEIAMVLDNDSDKIILSKGEKRFLEPRSEIPILKDYTLAGLNKPMIVEEGNKKYIVTAVDSECMNWTYLTIVSLDQYGNNVADIMKYVQRQLIIYFGVSLLLSYFLTLKTYEPIHEIMKIIENPSLWNVKDNPVKGELSYISENILKIIFSNEDMEKELREKIQLLDKAQNKALQSQMNPHFLYNTLEMINFEAMEISGGQNPVSTMISDLSMLLRYSLDGEQYGTVKEEMASVEKYLDIMNERNEGRIEYKFYVQEHIENVKILKLSIQPLAENAIYHGIKPLRQKGCITIKIFEKNGCLVVLVEDNGKGMREKRLKQLNEQLNSAYLLKKEGIGLYNVHQRIKILYGKEYGLEIKSVEDKGTTVVLVIPIEKK